jgi:hypothetical protein
MPAPTVAPHSSRTITVNLPDELWAKIDREWITHQLSLDAIVSVYLRLFMSSPSYYGPDADKPS